MRVIRLATRDVGLLILVLAALLLLRVSPGAAQNLANRDFDTDLADWANEEGTAEWDEADAFSADNSGSALLTNYSTSVAQEPLRQCVNLIWGKPYGFGARYLIPAGQVSAGSAEVRIYTYPYPDCSGTVTGTYSSSTGSGVANWGVLTGSFDAGVSFSVKVALRINKPSGPPLSIHFDTVRIDIFSDSFESGNTSCWSATVQ